MNGHEAQSRIAAAEPLNDPAQQIEGVTDASETALRYQVEQIVDDVDKRLVTRADGAVPHVIVKGNFSASVWVWNTSLATFFLAAVSDN